MKEKMRRVIIPLLALALASFASPAAAEQGSWQPRLSLYSGEFYSIAFASETTVWATGPGGVLLSEDGGASWRWTLNTPVNAVEPAGDGMHGWAVGVGGAIFATSDGGKSWNQQQSGTDVYLDSISAFDSQRAVTMGAVATGDIPESFRRNAVLRTEDGGATWVPVQLPEKVELDSLAALRGGSKAWLSATKCNPDPAAPNGCTYGDKVLLTSDDSGRTWKEIASQTLWGMKFVSASTGWALGPSLLRTGDGGKSWQVVRDITAENKAFADLSVLGEDTLMLVEIDPNTSMQQIVKTADVGATWTNVGPPTIAMSALIYFDEQHAIRSNLNQTLQSSGDGGLTWRLGTTPAFATRFRLAIDFIDPANGWATATKLLRTRDGGLSWEAVSDQQFDSLDFISSTEGWATQTVCLAGPCESIVFHSVDGGATWVEQVRHEASDTPHVAFVDRLNGWVAFGQGKPLLHTRDGGIAWSEQQHPGTGVVAFVDASTLWAASDPAATGGSAVSVYLSRDGGDSWSPAGNLLSQNCWPEVMAAADAAHAWYVSPDCIQNPRAALLRTVDGGATWQEVSPMSNGTFEHLAFFTPTDGVAVETVCPRSPVSSNSECQSQLLGTRDGGYTWTIGLTAPSTGTFKDYLFTDLWHGWRVDTFGGGMMAVQKQVVESYSAMPPVVLPTTGEGRGSGSPTTALAALGAMGLALLSVGGFARLRDRRRRDAGG